MKNGKAINKPMMMVAGFALLNVVMYLVIGKFWIGGSSFLPMIGISGPNHKFLFAFIVNIGLIVGSLIGALTSREFRLRVPHPSDLPRAVLGGIMIGIGVTLAPGTCTTSFVTGMPMLSVSSFLSAAGIFIGAYIMFTIIWRRK